MSVSGVTTFLQNDLCQTGIEQQLFLFTFKMIHAIFKSFYSIKKSNNRTECRPIFSQ